MAESTLACKNPGCKKKFLESENNDQACRYHAGKPLFHDLKKGWTCCNKIVYDWDDFEKIEPCAVGRHSTVDINNATGQDQFFKSSTVQNAQVALDKEQSRVKTIEEFNKEQEEIKKKKEEEQAKVEKKTFVTPKGNHKCINKGCLKEYAPDDNQDGSCKYHPGEPIFHDLVKSWSCCKIETWDWDDFVKIVPCANGKHNPKLV